jgi:hypothetical protein
VNPYLITDDDDDDEDDDDDDNDENPVPFDIELHLSGVTSMLSMLGMPEVVSEPHPQPVPWSPVYIFLPYTLLYCLVGHVFCNLRL